MPADLISRRQGRGEVVRGKEKLAKVTYDIALYRDDDEGRRLGGNFRVGTPRLEGRITEGAEALAGVLGAKLTLKLQDGSKLDFFLESATSGRIVTTGGMYR
jgi:hypothetical protein